MKAIIIGGGQGLRLRPLTESVPKCLLPVGEKRIIDFILEAFKKSGIKDISIVAGYKGDLIKSGFKKLKFYNDSHYQKSSILRGLFCAQKEMSAGFVASYSDILYRAHIVRKLIQDKGDFTIAVEKNWRKKYKNRKLHPESEAEKVVIKDRKVIRIGKDLNSGEANAEFIGLTKFSAKGARIAVKLYNQLVREYAGKPFHSVKEFERAYLTDFFQELVDRGYQVSPVFIQGGWIEIDTIEDLKKQKFFKK